MTGATGPLFPDIVREYLANPSGANARRIENWLAAYSKEAADAMWFLIDMLREAKNDLATEQKISKKLEELAKHRASPVINNSNVNQSGNGNTAQTGEGTQTVSDGSKGDDR